MTDVKRIETGVGDDDVFAEIVAGDRPTPTVLAGLREELARKVAKEPVTLVIPDRPKIRVRYSTDIDASAVQGWRRKARNKAMEDGIDALKFAVIVIANLMTGLQYDDGDGRWLDVTDDDGDPLTFRGDLTTWLIPNPGPGQTRTITDGVRHLYGSDAAIFKTVEAIFSAAGYSADEDEAVDEDPTVLS